MTDTFFVISSGVASSTTNRTRKTTEQEAVDYAKVLLKRRMQEIGYRKGTTAIAPLYVVKLVKVVEVESPACGP